MTNSEWNVADADNVLSTDYMYSVFFPLRFDFFSIHFNNADDYPNDVCLFTRFTSDSYVRYNSEK